MNHYELALPYYHWVEYMGRRWYCSFAYEAGDPEATEGKPWVVLSPAPHSNTAIDVIGEPAKLRD